MENIRCTVERITYQNEENGWSVLRVNVKGYKDVVTLVGNFCDTKVGAVLAVEGNWRMDAKFGKQFQAVNWKEELPSSIVGIEKYLGSGLIKGIGSVYAKKIVAKFGEETLNIIEEDIQRLSEVDGIGKKRIDLIAKSWEKQKDVKDIMVFLQGNGVSSAYAAKIYKAYGKESIDKVKENPYRLADDIWGIGFKTADSIAKNMGYAENDIRRCKSGIIYSLNQLANDGHVYATREQLIKDANERLGLAEIAANSQTTVPNTSTSSPITEEIPLGMVAEPTPQMRPPVEQALEELISAEELKVEDECIYLPPFYYSEVGVAKKLLELRNAKQDNLFAGQVNMEAIEKESGITYDDVQQAAIHMAAESKVMVLTGGPGTGKTTTTQGIISAWKTAGLSILLAAPTGRAAKRMSEATGMEAKTIHRLLGFKPTEGYKFNEENPLDGDALIVDECSMIDIILMYSLLKAIPLTMRLVLVGDIDQLPSVGAGNVLRDIIESEAIPVTRLTRIFRQAQSSRIVMNAHAINQGYFPNIQNGKDTDFFFIRTEEPQDAVPQIVNLVKNRLPKAYGRPVSDVQVLTPMRRSYCGSDNLNIELQKALNPMGVSLSFGGTLYRSGDRVMQIRNNYDKDVYNGDIGTISDVDLEENELLVSFGDKVVTYEKSELDELVLAYATTIHKSQGSEYPIVVIPVFYSFFTLLQRNLIYTAITRAKKICVLIGQMKALGYAVKNFTVEQRNTKLKERLRTNE
ncbi:MAG: ATP-dependent RecD-like DNA helicase [Prevotella sp.]|nr:ATP-dependent RecD-like DNA helicase [Prevotella sp.]